MSHKEDRGWNIYRRRSGGLVLQFRTGPRGAPWKEHRIPAEYRTQRQAERYAVAWLDEYTKSLGARPSSPVEPPPEKAPTIRALYGRWLRLRDSNPALSAAIRGQGRSNMKTHILTHPIADIPIEPDVGSAGFRAWVREIRDRGKVTRNSDGKVIKREPLAPMTTRNVVNTLTTFFDDAMAEEWIAVPANPMRHPGVRKEIPPAETMGERRGLRRGEKSHITIEHAERLVTCAAVPEHRRVLYLLALTSGGFRSGELYGATWADVALDAPIPCIHITKSLAEKGPQGRNSIGRTKTKDGVRTNPIHHLAVEALRAWKAEGWARRVGRQPRPTDPVFPDETGAPRRPRDAANVRNDLEKAGCPTTYGTETLTFKDVTRHSFATWLGAASVADEVIGRLLGHAARTVTRRHYVGEDLATLRDAIERITLDLACGEVIALPPAATFAQRSLLTALLTATRGKRAVNDVVEGGAKLAKARHLGGVAEWSKAAVLKTADGASCPGVRISPPPPTSFPGRVHLGDLTPELGRRFAARVDPISDPSRIAKALAQD